MTTTFNDSPTLPSVTIWTQDNPAPGARAARAYGEALQHVIDARAAAEQIDVIIGPGSDFAARAHSAADRADDHLKAMRDDNDSEQGLARKDRHLIQIQAEKGYCQDLYRQAAATIPASEKARR